MTLTRNAQVRVWLSRALATPVPGPRFQALHILPQRRSVHTPTLKSRTSEASFLFLKGNQTWAWVPGNPKACPTPIKGKHTNHGILVGHICGHMDRARESPEPEESFGRAHVFLCSGTLSSHPRLRANVNEHPNVSSQAQLSQSGALGHR